MSKLGFRFRDAVIGPPDTAIFRHFDWTVEPLQAWVITGANGSGKSALVAALSGALPVTTHAAIEGAADERAAPSTRFGSSLHASPSAALDDGAFRLSRAPDVTMDADPARRDNALPDPKTVALISFERQRDVMFEERYHDDSEFVEGGVDPGTSALDFMLGRKRGLGARARERAPLAESPERLPELVSRLGIEGLLGRGLKYLSTGEIRKVLLCRELLREPAWLVFDEPYEGLDGATRLVLGAEIERSIAAAKNGAGAGILVVSDRYEHLPRAATHVLHVEHARVAYAGPRMEFEARGIPADLRRLDGPEAENLNRALRESLGGNDTPSARSEPAELVRLDDVTVTYGGRRVLDRVNLRVRRGEHTLVRGANGCGKTTLLNLINGDNPQAYANDVYICDRKRGSGESIWEIKKLIGQVSYALHVEYAYRCRANVIESVLSGFHDSIGLYREPNFEELATAERWLGVVGLLEKRARPFLELSYGEQRLALILRAIVKQPPLLILDEPCHGLDPQHRGAVLAIAEYIATHGASTLIYVTHDPEEHLSCTRQTFAYDDATGWQLRRHGMDWALSGAPKRADRAAGSRSTKDR